MHFQLLAKDEIHGMLNALENPDVIDVVARATVWLCKAKTRHAAVLATQDLTIADFLKQAKSASEYIPRPPVRSARPR